MMIFLGDQDCGLNLLDFVYLGISSVRSAPRELRPVGCLQLPKQ